MKFLTKNDSWDISLPRFFTKNESWEEKKNVCYPVWLLKMTVEINCYPVFSLKMIVEITRYPIFSLKMRVELKKDGVSVLLKFNFCWEAGKATVVRNQGWLGEQQCKEHYYSFVWENYIWIRWEQQDVKMEAETCLYGIYTPHSKTMVLFFIFEFLNILKIIRKCRQKKKIEKIGNGTCCQQNNRK